MVTKICGICGKEFRTYTSHYDRRRYCSRECYHEAMKKGKYPYCGYQKGHQNYNTEESKKKISRTLKGRVKSKETRRKLSKALKGENSSGWKGGVTSKNKILRESTAFREWRKRVFEQNNYICQKCCKKGGNLHPHHIENFADYPSIRFDVKNGITFCKKCHWIFHKKFGFKGTVKEQLKQFLENL